METREYIEHVLRRAEDKLAVRLKEAVEHRQYAAAAELASISEKVRDLVQSAGIAERSRDQQEMGLPGHAEPDAGRKAKARSSSSPSSSGVERRAGRRYPRFVCSEGRLVKVGWSKKDGAEYEHRASEVSVRAVVAALRDLELREFSMDQLMPVDDGSGAQVPSYQVYLIVAWLRSVGAVRRAGRGGYVAVPGGLSTAAMEQHWRALDADASAKGETNSE